MTNIDVEQKPSETALFAALRRTIANKAFNNGKLLGQITGHFRFAMASPR
jgi:hypothetical protein